MSTEESQVQVHYLAVGPQDPIKITQATNTSVISISLGLVGCPGER